MMVAETPGRTVQLFLVDGAPAGLRKATIHGCTGLIFVATASTFASLTARGEIVQRSYSGLKQKLIAEGVLVPHGAEMMTFAKPYPFSSPSAAAAVVLDRNSNGRIEWKVKGSKQNYHDWQQVRAAKEEVGHG
jgi:hypothetical protein